MTLPARPAHGLEGGAGLLQYHAVPGNSAQLRIFWRRLQAVAERFSSRGWWRSRTACPARSRPQVHEFQQGSGAHLESPSEPRTTRSGGGCPATSGGQSLFSGHFRSATSTKSRASQMPAFVELLGRRPVWLGIVARRVVWIISCRKTTKLLGL
jgi:hypothetical protein